MFPKIGVSQNGWSIIENPIEMDDLGGTTIFGNIHLGPTCFSVFLTALHLHTNDTIFRLEHLCSFISQIQRVLGQIQTLTHTHTHNSLFWAREFNSYSTSNKVRVRIIKMQYRSCQNSQPAKHILSKHSNKWNRNTMYSCMTMFAYRWILMYSRFIYVRERVCSNKKTSINIIKSLRSACSQCSMWDDCTSVPIEGYYSTSNWRRLLHSFSIESTHNQNSEPMPIYST